MLNDIHAVGSSVDPRQPERGVVYCLCVDDLLQRGCNSLMVGRQTTRAVTPFECEVVRVVVFHYTIDDMGCGLFFGVEQNPPASSYMQFLWPREAQVGLHSLHAALRKARRIIHLAVE